MNSLSTQISTVKPSIGMVGFYTPLGDNKGTIGIRGTAFCVGPLSYMTAFHVYKNMKVEEQKNVKIWIQDPDNALNYVMCNASLQAYDEEFDLVLIKVLDTFDQRHNGKETKIKPLASARQDRVAEGDPVFFAGFPESTMMLAPGRRETSFVAVHGIIAAKKQHVKTGRVTTYFIDTNADKGFSGAPLISRDDGKVIGVIAGRFGKEIQGTPNTFAVTGLGIARPVDSILEKVQSTM